MLRCPNQIHLGSTFTMLLSYLQYNAYTKNHACTLALQHEVLDHVTRMSHGVHLSESCSGSEG